MPLFECHPAFPLFNENVPLFSIFRIDCAMYYCVCCLFAISSSIYMITELAQAKDIPGPGYLGSGKIQLCTLAVTTNTRLSFSVHFVVRYWDCRFVAKFGLALLIVTW